MSDDPSAVMSESGDIVSWNSGWPGACNEPAIELPTLRQSLAGYRGVDELVDAIRAGSRTCSHAMSGAVDIASGTYPAAHYDARWKHYASARGVPGYTVLVLKPERCVEAADARLGIDRLVVRQALIEEAERLRIGRALHDTVVQDLALIRGEFMDKGKSGHDPSAGVAAIDRLIDRVRTLSFELSPPLLLDLGLIATLHWLGEHIGGKYNVSISVVDDGVEPRLEQATKTILFRCLRELVINAAKHAAGSEIAITCQSDASVALLRVSDHGPGFDTEHVDSLLDDHAGFGLTSVRQQIRGIGASFELVSEVGSGTRATIRVPLTEGEGSAVD